MAQKAEPKWQILREFLSGYIQENTQYRAGTIYEDYLNEGGSSKITRKDFEMFLRDQVQKDDGMLKRVSHGVYEMRTSPEDKGVVFTRLKADAPQLSLNDSLDELLDESYEINSKVNVIFQKLENLDGISFPAQMELKRLKALLTNGMDTAITNISATVAWCEDNIPDESQTVAEAINMGGI